MTSDEKSFLYNSGTPPKEALSHDLKEILVNFGKKVDVHNLALQTSTLRDKVGGGQLGERLRLLSRLTTRPEALLVEWLSAPTNNP